MLFGSEDFKNNLLNNVAKCEQEQGFRVIYGAVVGSISKGIQYCNSDYDTRFLYINNTFPKEIIIPDSIAEEKIIYRKYFDDTPFDKIPFWEFSSFLQFLINPMIDNKFSVGLYNVVGWTFLSPYTYDPYGIQNKILPLIQKTFYKDYCIEYHKTLLEHINLEDKQVITKDYLGALHAALSIDWMRKYNEYPPLYMRTLVSIEPSLADIAEELLLTAQTEDRKFVYEPSSRKYYSSHCIIYTEHIALLDSYIARVKEDMKTFKCTKITNELQAENRRSVQRIYNIIDKTLNREEKVRYINKE